MKSLATPDRLNNHSHLLIKLLSVLLILVLALRRSYDLSGSFTLVLALLILGMFSILFASEPLFSRRFKSYPRMYFIVQASLVLAIGIFREYQDTWSVLFIILGFQVALRCSRKEAIFWFGLFITLLFITLSFEFGMISGPGRALAYIVIGAFLISYDIQYGQHEDALAESQLLVSELQEANQKLMEYAAGSEQLAAMEERNRMVQVLYDSVGQRIFAIQLAAETARLMLEEDPGQAAGQLHELQEQTQSTLRQMRQLIDQWRPPASG